MERRDNKRLRRPMGGRAWTVMRRGPRPSLRRRAVIARGGGGGCTKFAPDGETGLCFSLLLLFTSSGLTLDAPRAV